ncbi:MAG: efflux RND transporter permease subunit [Maritimibacter sp.]
MRAPSAAAKGILSYFTRHATVANLLLVVLIAAGVFAYPRMRAQFFPDVVVDDVRVSVAWEGAGAEDVDTGIVQVLEPTLMTVDGVTASSSRSSEGRASIQLEFEPGWDMAQAAADVETAVDGVSNLPDSADDPVVRQGGWRDRVTDVVITGPVGVDQLARFADEMVARLFDAGVTQATIRGVLAPQTMVEVSTASLVQNDITMAEIATAIAAEADTSPAGDLGSGTARVRSGVAKRSPEDLAGIVLRSDDDGHALTIGDVATLSVQGIDRGRAFFVAGNPAVTMTVTRAARGDAIKMQAAVEDAARDVMISLPEGVEIDLIRARSEVITGRLDILLKNGLSGLALVVVLLFLFLNARIAVWVAAGIPVAMTAAIALMFASGLTINMISLFALIITLGIVVDDAIVVGEHADFRARKLGEDAVTAAENAARRMWPPVFSATLTTIIAFFGLTAIGGRFGDLISDIPFTVIVVLLASLAECFLILPNHMSHALAHTDKDHWYDWPSRQVNRGFEFVRDGVFRPLIRIVIKARYPVMALALVALASQAALFIRGDVPFRFFNAPEQGTVTANFSMVNGATRTDTLAMLDDVQTTVISVANRLEAEHGVNPVTYLLAEIGGSSGRGLASAEDKDADLLGSISIELIDADSRPYSSFAFVSELQDAMPKSPLLEELTFRGGRFGPGGDALDIQLTGAQAQTLKNAAEDLKNTLAQYPEISALEDSLAYDKEELVLQLTPQGQALGFTIDGIGRVLRNRLAGIEAATYPDGMRSASIRVEMPEGELSAEFLERSQMRSPTGAYVNLADIVTITSNTGFSTVIRENGLRVVSVTGDLDEDDAARSEEIQAALEEDILPSLAENYGIEYKMAGLSEQQDEFLSGAMTGLVLCLVGIYLTLAWIFSSWARPVVVMAIIPFGLVGAILGHFAWGISLSMFSIVGLIGMVGIVINDSIVLVSTIDEYAEDRGLFPAIVDAACDRLRPVFLTTATTVLGLTPLLFEGSNQAEFLKPTVVTLVYGLGVGFFLVLIVVPAMVAMQDDIGRQINSFKRMLRAGNRAGAAAWPVWGASVFMVALFVATVGRRFAIGAYDDTGAMVAAVATFVVGSLGGAIVAWIIGAVMHARRAKP